MNSTTEKRIKLRLLWLALIVGIALCSAKFYAFYLTGSTLILSDAIESIINVVVSGFALFTLYIALQPKDSNHPYGHGKIEFFASGMEGTLIALSSFVICYKAVESLLHPDAPQNLSSGILITVFAGAINLVVGLLMRNKGKQLHSISIEADGRHLLADSLSSAAMVVGLLLVKYTGWQPLDPLLSICLAIYIFITGFSLVRRSYAGLMDEANEEILEKILKTLNTQRSENWLDVHNLRVQSFGGDLHIDCHLSMPKTLTFEEVHNEIKKFELLIQAALQRQTEVFVHADPVESGIVDFRQWTMENITRNVKHYNYK